MSQKLPVNVFRWFEDLSKTDEGFIKSCNERSKRGYFVEIHIQYPKYLYHVQYDLPFYQKEWILKKLKNLLSIYKIKLNMLFPHEI